MRKALTVVGALGLVAGLAMPANAGPGDTTTTFTLAAAGGLQLTAPASKAYGSVNLGAALTGALGTVQVVDDRGTLLGGWTATVASSDFVTPDLIDGNVDADTLASRTIPKSAVSYNAGLVTFLPSVGTFAPGLPGTLAAPRTAATAAVTVGRTTASWDPTLTVNVPAAAVTGDYSGTITHSVA